MKIAYHGLGYVGLTGAVHFALAGIDVIGFDPDPTIAAAVNDGKPKHGEFLSYLGDKLSAASGHLRATTQFADTLEADVHIVAVPTERKGEPFDAIVFEVLTKLWQSAKDGAIVLVESTLAPGTIDRWVATVPKAYAQYEVTQAADGASSGVAVRASRDVADIGTGKFHLAVCPRRDWFADQSKSLAALPRIVGGYTPLSTEMAEDVLSHVSTKILRTTYRTAEITKALENALLHVPLMYVHQLAMALPEHDVAEAVRLAGTHWRLMPLHLNVGTGGRCLGENEMVFSWDGAEAQVESIKAFVERFRPGFKVLSRSAEGELRFSDVTNVGARRAEAVLIRARGGHRVVASTDHRMYVRRRVEKKKPTADGRMRRGPVIEEMVVEATHLQSGDELVFVKSTLPRVFEQYTFDLVDYASGGWVMPNDARQYLVTGAGPSARGVPRMIAVDGDLAELLGLYAAEGWVSQETSTTRCGLGFNADEDDLIEFSVRTLTKLGLTPTVEPSKKNHATSVKVSHHGWSQLVAAQVGTCSYDVRVPRCVLLGPEKWQKRFLRGLFRGDGSIEKSGQICYYTASSSLANALMLMLRSYGLEPSMHHDKWRHAAVKYRINVGGDQAKEFFAELLDGTSKRNKTALIPRGRNTRWGTRTGSGTKRPVVQSVTSVGLKDVYSIDVEGDENFVTTGGLLVHNCVPLGSKYLLGAAGEKLTIGKAVVDAEEEVRRAAAVTMRNQVGHGLVAVLGIAYRPGFRDMGLSPGLDVAKHLHKTGNVVINDPMWTDEELVAMTGLETMALDRLSDVSGIVLATPHEAYQQLPERAELWRPGQVVLDAQGAWREYRALFSERGVRYVCVGEPGWLK